MSKISSKNINRLNLPQSPVVLTILDGWGDREDASNNAIKNALKHIKDAYSLLAAEDSIELLVEDINRSIGFLDSITKKTTKDDVLDAVFSSFCVGK